MDTIRAMSNESRRTKLPRTIAKVNGTETEFIIDTGAGLNFLLKNGFDNLRHLLYADEGVSLLKDFSVKLHIDDSVPPVAKPHRRIPINLQEKVKEKLRQLEKNEIIEKVDGPTP